MKVLAVLSALASIAIAAPALEENNSRTIVTPGDFTITQQREKKSTLLETPSEKLSEHSEDQTLAKTTNKFGSGGSVARTFSGFKKPIIVKKKIGYHVYRDSDEEQAQTDSRESCRKQIKVKLCDDTNSIDKIKSASIDHTHDEISETEMKHSINMAKEAVETFQRDLEKMEHDSTENKEGRHTSLGTDKELHEDIEKARQALEHIQKKFENLDSVPTKGENNLKSESIKSDEERMALWKEVQNKHKSIEVGKNLEDNFKSTGEINEHKRINSNIFKARNLNDVGKDLQSITTIEDVDSRSSNQMAENKIEDSMTSIIEDKQTKMDIQSDNLKKENSGNQHANENFKSTLSTKQNSKELTEMVEKSTDIDLAQKHLRAKENADDNHSNMQDHARTLDKHLTKELDRERLNEDKDNKLQSSEKLKSHTTDVHERHDLKENSMLKSSDGSLPSQADDHTKIKLNNELQNDEIRPMNENEQVTHESHFGSVNSNSDDIKATRSDVSEFMNDGNKMDKVQHSLTKNHGHKNIVELSSSLKKSKSAMPSQQKIEADETSKQKQQELHTDTALQRTLGTDMDAQRSALHKTSMKLDNQLENHMDGIHDKVHTEPDHLRATSNFHKDLLNNMDFIEDSHQMPLNRPSPTDTSHQNEKAKLQERFNMAQVQPNSDHLKAMMRLSDNPHYEMVQRPQTKMVSMLNNEQPNINVQFNSPQTFEEQTNVQGLMPFKAAENVRDAHLHKSNVVDTLDTMHNKGDKGDISSDLHDPLKIRWAHENSLNLEKIKAASQMQEDGMKMDGSSQHFNIDKSVMGRNNFMDQHLDLNNQINTHQRWTQGKNSHNHMQSGMTLQNFQTNLQRNDNLQQLHSHDAFDHNTMLHGKSNIDMQPNTFMHMRGSPKMALEYANANQWAPNQGAFRSSYGPGPSNSYGSSGGSASGGSAVGLFPNANVGNCAVPLLVSCSPSVVSGSLAKTNTYSANSYSAPSYRSDDSSFLKKRGIDIDERRQGLKVQRHIPLSHKPNIILDKKE